MKTERSLIIGKSNVGKGTIVAWNTVVGYPAANEIGRDLSGIAGATIGKDCIIRSGTIIYSNSTLGNNVRTGHNAVIREWSTVGNDSMIGTNVVVENDCRIGKNVSLQTNAYIATNTKIGDNVFVGPGVITTNDKYLGKVKSKLVGPDVGDGVSIGAGAIILPKIRIGRNSIIGAGAIVTRNVPENSVVRGRLAAVVGKADVTIERWGKIEKK